MTQIEQMIFLDGVEEGIRIGRSEGLMQARSEGKRFTARNLYAKGFSAAETIGESCTLVSAWYGEWAKK